MNLVSRLLGVAVAVMGMLGLPGCDPQNIKELEEGLSTEADVRARFGEPEEVAAMVTWLSTEECSFSTGAVFDLSGGRSTY